MNKFELKISKYSSDHKTIKKSPPLNYLESRFKNLWNNSLYFKLIKIVYLILRKKSSLVISHKYSLLQ